MRFRARVVFIAVSVLRSLRLNSARGPGLAPGALCRNRFLDVLLPDGLQLLVLRGAKNFLQLRRAFAVDGVELLHVLHSGKRRIILDRLEFWSLGLEYGQHLNLLLRLPLSLLRQSDHFLLRSGRLAW